MKNLSKLFSADMLWLAWLPVGIIGVLHYSTGAHNHWVHDILRRLYYVPILFAAYSKGRNGGLAVAIVVSLSYAPHAFFVMESSQDPGTTLNKLLEILLYNTIGILSGVLADREALRRIQVENSLKEQKEMAGQLVRAGRLAALGELVAGISHEIKNPLHTIKGSAEIVDEIVPKNLDQSGMWIVLRQEIDRLDRIAERFLSFARPTPPKFKLLEIGDIYDRIVELLIAQFHNSPQIDLRVTELASSLKSLKVRVDRDQLAQIGLNIASNAIRAIKGQGYFEVNALSRFENNKEWLQLSFENNGPIINVDNLERIFNPFYTRSDNGTGLGLAIAERIAEAHNGFLRVENVGNTKGVVFMLMLPLVTDHT